MRPSIVILAGLVLAHSAAAEGPATLETGVRSSDAATSETHDWGRMLTYFAGTSYSSTDALAAVATIHPGMEIHPPHVHSEEEYLMVLEGTGTWSVQGQEFAAKAGDLLYAAPWDEHGISNTGDVPLKFVVVKWNPNPVSPMAQPVDEE